MQNYRLFLNRALRVAGHLTEPVAGKIKSYHVIVARQQIQCPKLEIMEVAGIAVDHHYRSAATLVDIMQLCMARYYESIRCFR